MKNIIKLLFLGLLAYSCNEDKFLTYKETTPKIYFQQDASISKNSLGLIVQIKYRDSMFYNFAGSQDNHIYSPVYVPVKLMGMPIDRDRPIDFKVNTSLSTAIEGVDFEIDKTICTIPAGKVMGNVIVNLKRTPILLKKQLQVVLDLVPNDYFQLALEKYNNSNNWNDANVLISGHRFKVIFTESVSEPKFWTSYAKPNFGPWSVEKYTVVNNSLKWTIQNWTDAGKPTSPIAIGTLPYGAYKTQQYLQNAADSGKPIIDVDGKYMQLGASYLVDYSAYEK